MNKLSVKDIIDYGFVDLINQIGNLYYLEFYFCTKHSDRNCRDMNENRYYLGTIVCDENGCIYKSCLKSYCFSQGNQYIGFTQIINKNDKININELFTIPEDNIIQFIVPSIKETVDISSGSRLWANVIRNKIHIYTDKLYIGNVCGKDFFIEMQNRENIIEFFREEHNKFGVLANSIVKNGELVKCGLDNVAHSMVSAMGDFTYFYRKATGILGH